jgi:LDH2 family malate/lactate/ureidoglycolate dehydrogenase
MTAEATTRVFAVEDLTARATEILAAAGVGIDDARVVADSLVDADMRGIHSHGVNRLGIYLDRLRAGGNKPTAAIRTIRDSLALAVLDAQGALSQVAAARAIEVAAQKAAVVGTATVLVRGGSHFGAAGYWARRLAESGMLGIAVTNTSPLMAAWGGVDGAIGTNPIAFAFPSAGDAPVVVDLATSEATWGALINARAAGEPIPTGWALGADGRPTTSAAEAVEERRMLPFGRHKGYALAVAIELMAGALAGASCLGAIADMYAEPEREMAVGHLFLAIDPAHAEERPGDVARAVQDVQSQLEALSPAPGVDRVLWPGQLEYERTLRARQQGLEIPAEIADALEALEPGARR